MARIKINDLGSNVNPTEEEVKRIQGGATRSQSQFLLGDGSVRPASLFILPEFKKV